MSRARARAWIVGVGLIALVAPPFPLVLRRSLRLAALFLLIWTVTLLIFFHVAAGPGFLLHMLLWACALALAARERWRVQAEARLERLLAKRTSV